MDNHPKYLYHYTNLESLALILKNKTIRFSPLNKLDDMDEEKLGNFSVSTKYVFVSSWTETHTESIPFWNMYTRKMHGVRIKMRANPFKRYKNKVADKTWIGSGFEKEYDTFFDEAKYKDCTILPNIHKFFFPVKYTDNEEDLYPKAIDGNEFNIDLIGISKRKEWEFQKEWRYKLICLPMTSEEMDAENSGDLLYDRIEKGVNLPFCYIDLDIEEKNLEGIEIMSGPKMTEGEKELLRLLVEKYCPSANVVESKLKIR